MDSTGEEDEKKKGHSPIRMTLDNNKKPKLTCGRISLSAALKQHPKMDTPGKNQQSRVCFREAHGAYSTWSYHWTINSRQGPSESIHKKRAALRPSMTFRSLSAHRRLWWELARVNLLLFPGEGVDLRQWHICERCSWKMWTEHIIRCFLLLFFSLAIRNFGWSTSIKILAKSVPKLRE